MGKITAPEPLTPAHLSNDFDCGEESLDFWLKKYALKNEAVGASRTFVVCCNRQIIGYYALAAGSVAQQEAPGKVKRKMPDPIPVMVLGRLAVDKRWQEKGIGRGLLKDALLRTLAVSSQVGIRAILVHALSEKAKEFYLRHGFSASPIDPLTLMLRLQDIRLPQ